MAYREHRPAIVDYLRRRTGDLALAEDLAQDVFVAALVAQPRMSKAGKPLLAWLYVVARRRAIDVARSARRGPWVALDDASDTTGSEGGRVSAEAIVEGIRALPVEQQRVALLRLVSGGSFAEIGATLGVDAAVCRVRFSRALRALRESLHQVAIALTLALAEAGGEWLDDVCGCI